MARNALAFVLEKHNTYSIAKLIGAVESNERLQDVHIALLRSQLGLSEQVETLAQEYDRVVVGFSFTTPDVLTVFPAVRRLRRQLASQRLNNVTLVAGGPHPSGDWTGTLGAGFDLVVVGEGESCLPELLLRLYAGADLGDVAGLAYPEGAEVVFNGRSQRVQKLDDYPPFAEKFGLFSPIEISRGCPWACKFCQASFLFRGRMRHRSIANVVHWVEASSRQGKGEIRFIAPDAFAYGSDGRTLRLDLLEQLLRAVNAVVGREHTYLGSFPSEVRPDSVSPEALELVRRHAANDNLVIGAQSGSPRMLQRARRGHSVTDIYRAVELTLQAGLVANVDFIFGLPGETDEDRARSREVIEDLAALGARIHSHSFMPLAGTPWANAAPGQVDEKTRLLLEQLAGRGQQYGQWRQQRELAGKLPLPE